MTLRVDARLGARGLDVALEVADGETLALLGPNGAGKSTTLGLVAGTLRPDDGVVALDGRTLTHVTAGRTRAWVAPHDRHVALLAQEPLLFPHLSAVDNVAFGPRAQGARRAEAAARAAEWLDRVGVADLAARRPASLSGGQAQRVAVARALAADPRLLLLDEPMAALDVDVTPALRQTLRRVLADRTAVITTHDVLDALLLADRVAVVDGGRVVEQGPTAQVLGRPRSAFAASLAGLNLLTGVWTGDGVRTGGDAVVHGHGAPSVPDGGAAVAAFRPAAVSVFLEPVPGSPRNLLRGTVRTVEPHGDLLRVRGDQVAADVTPQAVAQLGLEPGLEVWFSVKAAEVDVYPA